jgi:hypothetical protein
MKRRTFILAAAATAVTVTGAVLYFSRKRSKSYDPLVMPQLLGQFCDEDEIRQIGNSYRAKRKEESNKEKLSGLLLTDSTGKKIEPSDQAEVTVLLNKKIHEEFQAYNTIILNGWIISTTEARQCALFSLTTPN